MHITPRGLQRGAKDGPGPQKAWSSAEGVDPLQANNSTELCSANLGTRTELVSLQYLGVTQNMAQSQWMDRHRRWCQRNRETAVPSRGRHEATSQKGWL